jgi:hypothetical protein
VDVHDTQYDIRYNGTTNRVIIAGGVSGGIYKSIDNGATWVRKSPTGEHYSCTNCWDTRAEIWIPGTIYWPKEEGFWQFCKEWNRIHSMEEQWCL